MSQYIETEGLSLHDYREVMTEAWRSKEGIPDWEKEKALKQIEVETTGDHPYFAQQYLEREGIIPPGTYLEYWPGSARMVHTLWVCGNGENEDEPTPSEAWGAEYDKKHVPDSKRNMIPMLRQKEMRALRNAVLHTLH